jgi:hypothetical protein
MSALEHDLMTALNWAGIDAAANTADFELAHELAKAPSLAGYVKAEPSWAETLINDGTYEYTVSSDCDGSNVQRWRRTPGLTYEGAASPWQTYEPEASK